MAPLMSGDLNNPLTFVLTYNVLILVVCGCQRVGFLAAHSWHMQTVVGKTLFSPCIRSKKKVFVF